VGLVVERMTYLSLRAKGRARGAPPIATARAPADVALLFVCSVWGGCCCVKGELAACPRGVFGVPGTESSATRNKETQFQPQ
jgi:hypothetical protein